jgi:NAD(P)-dependent dehydrogenase (short-subunit alcohol dehydrogenase family)
VDVSKTAEVDQMIQAAVSKFGSVDIVVANAGQCLMRPSNRNTHTHTHTHTHMHACRQTRAHTLSLSPSLKRVRIFFVYFTICILLRGKITRIAQTRHNHTHHTHTHTNHTHTHTCI